MSTSAKLNVKDFFGNEYKIVSCVSKDVSTHFDIVKNSISADEAEAFKMAMCTAVGLGSAYKIYDDSCFMYYVNENSRCAKSILMYGKNSPLKMIALFFGIFTQLDTHTLKLDFFVDQYDMGEFKSIVTMSSLKRRSDPNYPLVVRIDNTVDKLKAIYKARGL